MKHLVYVLIFILSGCITYSAGHTPNYTLLKHEYTTPQDITFSISIYQQIDNYSITPKKKMIEIIRKHLAESGLFRRVHYVPSISYASASHYHFSVMITGNSPQDRISAGIGSIYTLGIIPIVTTDNIDIAMTFYAKNKEIYSVSAPEKIKTIIWLPFIALSPFFNKTTTGYYVRNKIMKFFVNEIIKHRLYNYGIINKTFRHI